MSDLSISYRESSLFKVYLREIKYILEIDTGNSSQKGELLSQNCNKFEHKIPSFGLFNIVFKFTKPPLSQRD